jgi:hypothetical protein
LTFFCAATLGISGRQLRGFYNFNRALLAALPKHS